jgi:hypothetical protein
MPRPSRFRSLPPAVGVCDAPTCSRDPSLSESERLRTAIKPIPACQAYPLARICAGDGQ